MALHNPTSGNCLKPDVRSEPLAADYTKQMELVMGIGHRRLGYGSYDATAEVRLAADGNVEGAKLTQSSGDSDFDDAFMQDVQNTKYLPAVADCKQVPSVYVFATTQKVGN